MARVANIPQTIDILKQNGIWIFGTDASGESYTKADLTGPAALVIGSEGFGMGRLVREKCDYLVSLPTPPLRQAYSCMKLSDSVHERQIHLIIRVDKEAMVCLKRIIR